ncbi:MAG: family 10 glycosylhydrolase, partial [Lentisphaerae bacterium]|nr:family 10 glycosylhydrolase [Lentisphaerota bacterium]
MNLICRLSLILAVCLGHLVLGGPVPAPPAAEGLFPEFNLADTAAAQALFDPMDGSLPVTLGRVGQGAFVRLPVNLAGADHERASWDMRITADLAVARGIQFDFYCEDSRSIASFALYFRSGDGWFRTGFSPEKDGQWQRIVIDKSTTGTEGTPAGWGTIDTIRISAWRGGDKDTVCAIANVGPVGADADILVVRADSCASAGNRESKGYSQYAETVTACLGDAGLDHALLSDLDVTSERLAGRKLAILPYNPRLPEGLLSLLEEFVGGGGRVITCYSLADGIPELIGVKRGTWASAGEGGHYQGFARTAQGLAGQPALAGQRSWCSQPAEPIPGTSRAVAVWRGSDGVDTTIPAVVVSDRGGHVGHVWLKDDWGNKKALLLSLVGGIVPGVWETAAGAEFAGIGRFGGYADFQALHQDLATQTGQGREELNRAVRLRAKSKSLMADGEWVDSITASQDAATAALRAWCLTRKSEPGEFRAFWCHSAFGVAGKTWDEAIRQLADCGFTAILPNMLWGGTAYYESDVLPVHKRVAEEGDQIDACLAACRKYGVECHVWKVNWNMSGHASDETVAVMRKANRVQVNNTGEVQERWLCPSHPANRDLEVAAMVEVARKYAVDGIHFDYIRYPGRSNCFCAGCRERFEARIGASVANWPGDCARGGPNESAWLDFRRSNIDVVVKTVAKQAKEVRRDVDISAAVFRNWPVDRDGVGQDWKLWCDKRWLDFV